MTLNDLERRNGRVVCLISPNSVAFGAYYVKVVENKPLHSANERSPKNLVFNDISLMAICAGSYLPIEGVKVKRPTFASENLTYSVAQKMHHFCMPYQVLADFQNYFTIRIRRKFVILLSLKIPSRLECVATLPYEMSNVLQQLKTRRLV